MRGLYTATLLDALSRRAGPKNDTEARDLGRAFDLIVGTSTGGILTCALAAGHSTGEIVELYKEHGRAIFRRPIPNGKMRQLGFAVTHMASPANDASALRGKLRKVFGDVTIGDVYARRGIAFCIPTLDIGSHAPVVIKSGHFKDKHRDDSVLLVDACLATTAAPIVLPLARVPIDGIERTFVDGGLWANSPIIIALVEALQLCDKRPIEIVSVGTCSPPEGRYVAPSKSWGLGDWKFGVGAIEASLDAQAHAARHAFHMLTPFLKIPVSLVRLHQTAPPADYVSRMGLDRADEEAIDIMLQLGTRDAETIYSEMTRFNGPLAFLKDALANLPPIESHKQ